MRRLGLGGLAPLLLSLSPSAADDSVVQRISVPGPSDPEAEVLLLERDGLPVVQTRIHSRLMRRVVARICDKEADHWPPGSDGAEDSESYVTALRAARDTVWERFRARTDRSRRRQNLLIEFSAGPTAARVRLAEFEELADPDGFVGIRSSATLDELELGRDYVERNMKLILIDRFAIEPAEAERWLSAPGGDTE